MQFKSQLAEIGGHCPNKDGDKALLRKSRDHMISEPHDLPDEITSP